MSSIGSVLAPAAAAGIGRSLALARAANPRKSLAGSFDQHLSQALQAGVGGADSGAASNGKIPPASAQVALGGPGEVASLEALRAEHGTAMAEFEDRFRRLLRERGIDLGDGIVLQKDEHGEVRISGDHPQREAIELLFRDDAELRNSFVRLDAQASALRAADFAAQLARLQADAPNAAAAQVQELLNAAPPTRFSLAVRPSEMLTQFS